MKRRSFFGALVGAAAIAPVSARTIPPTRELTTWPSIDQPQHYHGYMLYWTGWKGAADHSWLTGQWLAWPLRGFGQADFPDRQPYLYLSAPGMIGGPYRAGSMFHIGNRDRVVLPDTPLMQREIWIADGQRYIQQLVDRYREQTADGCQYELSGFPEGTPLW